MSSAGIFPNLRIPVRIRLRVGNQVIEMVDPTAFDTFATEIRSALNALGGGTPGGVLLRGPINLGGNRIHGLVNTDTPTPDEALSASTAKSLYDPSVIRVAISSLGNFPLNVQGLQGVLAQAQPAGIPVVLSLPPVDLGLSSLDAVTSPTEAVVIYQNALWRLDLTTEPGTWREITTVGIIPSGLRANLPAPGIPGLPYIETDVKLLYIDDGSNYLYEAGIAVGTDATRLALTISTNDNGLPFLTTDTKKTWAVIAGVWIDITPTTTLPSFADAVVATDSGDHQTFTLPHAPNPAASLEAYSQPSGLLMVGGTHYTLVGATMTLTAPLPSGDTAPITWFRY